MKIRCGADLELLVCDNGVGIPVAICERGKENHFGLEGMRELAARIGAKFTVTSSSTSGTEVVLVVPGPIAFVGAKIYSALKDPSSTF